MYIGIDNEKDTADVMEYMIENDIGFRPYQDPLLAVCYEKVKRYNQKNDSIVESDEVVETAGDLYELVVPSVNMDLDLIVKLIYDVYVP